MTEEPSPEVIAALVARVARPDYERWAQQLQHTGGCARPVRLKGSRLQIDRQTGEATLAYSTGAEPDRVLLKACGSRRATRCPACSAVYRGDARALILAGLVGGKGAPEEIAGHPTVFATLTAPSHGAVHRSSDDQGCQPARAGRCRHGLPLGCGEHHQPDDLVLGTPLCLECYDYAGAVLFNARVGELWRRTTIATRRRTAEALGVPVREFERIGTVSFVKIAEYQRRGVVHLHALLRLDLPGEATGLEPSQLAQAVQRAARQTQAPNPLPAAMPIRWGPQIDTVPVDTFERARVAGYLAKYATKSTDGDGLLDHRIHLQAVDTLALPDHLRRMLHVLYELESQAELANLHLGEWAHTLGYRGHWLTKSPTWSTTLTALRQARRRWWIERHPDEERTPRADAIDVEDWRFLGLGHVNDGDALLARSASQSKRLNRRIAWEERI